MRMKRIFSGDNANSACHPDGRAKRRNRARVGRNGKAYFVLKPLNGEQLTLIRQMVAMGHGERAIAAAIGRSHEGTQKILRRMGLKTVHKARLDEKNRRKREALENKIRADRESIHVQR